MVRETAQQRVERYLRESRTVSGGKDGNPPDRYVVVTLSQKDKAASKQVSDLADKQSGGFRVIAFSNGRVIMGNYKE